MVITGLFKAEQRLPCPTVQKSIQGHVSPFAKLNLLRGTKQELHLPPQDGLGTLQLCCHFLCHTQQTLHISGHSCATQPVCCPFLWYFPIPNFQGHSMCPFLSLSLVSNTRFIISNLFATACTAATALAQGIAESTCSSQEQDEEQQE